MFYEMLAGGLVLLRHQRPQTAALWSIFAPALTGILRNFERYPNVVNLRASYLEEIEVLVDHMVNELGKRRFGVIYQDDAFGRSALADYQSVLNSYDLAVLAKSSYSPNTHAVHSSLFTLAKADLDAGAARGKPCCERGCHQSVGFIRTRVCNGQPVHRGFA